MGYMDRRLSKEDLIERLWEGVRENGSQSAYARKLGIQVSYLNDLLNGRREISKSAARAVGIRRETIYIEDKPAS